MKPTRREVLVTGAGMAVGAILTNFADPGKPPAGALSRSAEPTVIVDRTGDDDPTAWESVMVDLSHMSLAELKASAEEFKQTWK